MKSEAKKKAVLLLDKIQTSVSMKKLETVLSHLTELNIYECESETSIENILYADLENHFYIDQSLVEKFQLPLNENYKKNTITLLGEGAPSNSPAVFEWKKIFSFINVGLPNNKDLVRALQISLRQEFHQGLSTLCEKGATIQYEKLQGITNIGQVIDSIIAPLIEAQPEPSDRYFNLRQLSYAILHLAHSSASASGKLQAIVDFQIQTTPSRIAFCTKFRSPPNILPTWIADLYEKQNFNLYLAHQCADLVVITELRQTQEIEVKALIADERSQSSKIENSLLFNTIDCFKVDSKNKDARNENSLRKIKSTLPIVQNEPKKLPQDGNNEGSQENAEAGSENPSDLNIKIKADILEREKTNLQDLIKKKTHLIVSLNKDLNRAQREVVSSHNNAQKEVLKIKMEMESLKKEFVKQEKELKKLQKKISEEQTNTDSKNTKVEQERILAEQEKSIKQLEYAKRATEEKQEELNRKIGHLEETIADLRKKQQTLSIENNELKTKAFKLEKSLEQKNSEEKKTNADNGGDEKDTKNEAKRIQIKLDTAESNLKVLQQKYDKQVANSEKLLEDAKKQKTEALKKVEELNAQIKAKTEENNSNDRLLKEKIKELTSSLQKQMNSAPKKTAA